jgi:selenocysteine lyase/cysteine desulfurase
LAVDAIQGLGSLQCDVHALSIDFLCAASHKWMLGPNGVATLYIRKALLDELRVASVGVTSMDQGPSYLDYGLRLRPDARRFESGFPNLLGVTGLDAALDLFNEVGMNRVEAQILSLTRHLMEGLDARGYLLYGPRVDEHRSGVVSFRHPSKSSSELVRLLRAGRVVVSDRERHARVSPHFYNTQEEIDQLFDLLPPV